MATLTKEDIIGLENQTGMADFAKTLVEMKEGASTYGVFDSTEINHTIDSEAPEVLKNILQAAPQAGIGGNSGQATILSAVYDGIKGYEEKHGCMPRGDMAFVYWCVNEASNANRTKNPLLKTGGVLNQWNNRQNLKVSNPKVGEIFIMDYGKGLGHCGFVEKVNSDDTFEAIEGNTNRLGSREGDGVYRKTRNISSCKGFLRVGA